MFSHQSSEKLAEELGWCKVGLKALREARWGQPPKTFNLKRIIKRAVEYQPYGWDNYIAQLLYCPSVEINPKIELPREWVLLDMTPSFLEWYEENQTLAKRTKVIILGGNSLRTERLVKCFGEVVFLNPPIDVYQFMTIMNLDERRVRL